MCFEAASSDINAFFVVKRPVNSFGGTAYSWCQRTIEGVASCMLNLSLKDEHPSNLPAGEAKS